MRRKLAAGNWKMNGARAALFEIDSLTETHPSPQVDVVICPPATLLMPAADRTAANALDIGAQDCHTASAGAHTGDISAEMLADAGARYVILGHSERRADHGVTSADVRARALVARNAGLTPIICVGESLADREAGHAVEIVTAQLEASLPDETDGDTVVAYEPIWAIGTGKTASCADIAEIHSALRSALETRFGAQIAAQIRLLYGGSVKPANAAEIFATANVDGALVGGASLKASDFSPIIAALESAS